MLAVYIFCAALGVPLLALFALGGSDSDVEDAGLDVGDAGFDVGDVGDAGFDADGDFGGTSGDLGDFTGLIRRVPVSSYAFFLSFFGVMGLVGTAVLVLYGFMAGSNEDLFWSLFAFSAVIFLLPYLGMMLAFVRLRTRDPDHPRPFSIPGGILVAKLLAWTCFAVLSVAIVLFIYTPGEGVQWPVLLGAAALIALGEFAIRVAEKQATSGPDNQGKTASSGGASPTGD